MSHILAVHFHTFFLLFWTGAGLFHLSHVPLIEGSIIFFQSSVTDALRSSINTTPHTTPSSSSQNICKLVEDCPHLETLSNEELSKIRPCRFEENRAYYPCLPPSPSTSSLEPQNTVKPSKKTASVASCSSCLLGTICPETNALLVEKKFETLKSGFSLCGFENRHPKFCCPSMETEEEDRDDILRNGASEDSDDYQLRGIDVTAESPNAFSEETSVRFAGEEELSDESCGYTEPTRIRNGNDAGPHEHPWNVALLYKNDTMSKVLCGGVLISETEALTAAHCVRDFKGLLLTSILIGHSDINKATEVNLTGVTLHPNYSRTPIIVNDIAILHFDSIESIAEEVKIICMPLSDKFTRKDKYGVVSGWGVTELSLFSDNLKRLDVEIVEFEECQSLYKKKNKAFTLKDSQICASGQKEDSDSCSGDSGSPLLYYEPIEGRAVLLGLTSFGTRRCDSSVPGVYSKISSHLPWLRAAIAHARSILSPKKS